MIQHYKQCQVRDIWMLNSPRELPVDQQKCTLMWRGLCSCPPTSPLSITTALLMTPGCHLWLSPLPASLHPVLAQNVACFSNFSTLPSLPIHKTKMLIQALIIVAEMRDNLLPPGRDRSNLVPWNPFKMQMQKSSSWITASSTFPLFHPASPLTGSPFFYYIKHKLLAFILRVVLRWWQLIQMPYTSI